MITLHRSASILPGRFTSAVAYAKELAAFATKASGVEVGVTMPIGGNPFRIGWVARHENLGAMEAALGKLMADPTYAEFAAKSAENFIAGSYHDEIWRTI